MTTRITVEFPALSGLGEDVVSNTFHIGQPAAIPPLSPVAESLKIIAFYNDVRATGYSIAGFLGFSLNRGANAARMEFTNLADPAPRVPYYSRTWTVGPEINGASLMPEEVAVACSWQGDRVSGVPQARRRGRVFLGPLNTFALSNAGLGNSRPWATFRSTIAQAASALLADFAGELVVYSRTSVPPVATEITNGWIDDAFDTIRSRGPGPTVRTLFT